MQACRQASKQACLQVGACFQLDHRHQELILLIKLEEVRQQDLRHTLLEEDGLVGGV